MPAQPAEWIEIEPRVVDEVVIGRDGTHIPIRRYGVRERVSLIWLHGGGFVDGSLDMPESDWVCRQLASRGIGVVAVDYRLAPVPPLDEPRWQRIPQQVRERWMRRSGGQRYPAAVHDVQDVLAWLGGNPVLGGASAGGALAASVCSTAHAQGSALPSALALVYSQAHSRLPEPAEELLTKLATLDAGEWIQFHSIEGLTLNYLGDAELLDDPRAFPGGHELGFMPPALIVDAELDSLRASGQLFATELRQQGRTVEYVCEPGARHGFLNEPDEAARHTVARLADWVLRHAGSVHAL
ncbi:alpha/beta hydrolase fold domain-containing protein [Nonomuraea sp. NPDC050328]|uniref:alpha/beta hydrolase fold domain-containing protein n=1 Tax=Nonomuraea sp. NPDC050328 TaxID=3364361 RepID=UPI0037AAA0FB